MKKLLSLLLILCLLSSVIPPASAETQPQTKVPVTMPLRFRKVCMGGELNYAAAYAIDTDGALWTWGRTTTNPDGAPRILLEDVADISAGDSHAVALKRDGTVWTWGSNFNGRLGDGTEEHRDTPVRILDQVKAISAGTFHSLALRTDGTLWAWGPNSHGEIGDGTLTDALRPKQIANNVRAIAAGNEMSLFVKNDNTLWGMGSNMAAELGSLSFDNVLAPMRIMDDVRAVSASSGLLITGDGAACEFGEIWQREFKEYGHRDYQRRPSPQKILDGARAVESGDLLRYVIRTDGSLWAWGTNFYGQLGDGTDVGRGAPKKIMDGVTEVSTNGYSTLALKTDGSLWAWGMNSFGQLGNGTETDCWSPVQVIIPVTKEMPTRFYDVEAGAYYADAVRWALDGQITNGTDAAHFSPDRTCTRAQVVTFLWRASGSPEPALEENPFTDVAAGQYYRKAVLWAVEQGITTGTSAASFSPDAPCTRGQVVTFLHRAQGAPDPGSAVNPFTDVPAGRYDSEAVLWAVSHEPRITNGTSAATFSPDSTCTRGQIVTFLYRAMA